MKLLRWLPFFLSLSFTLNVQSVTAQTRQVSEQSIKSSDSSVQQENDYRLATHSDAQNATDFFQLGIELHDQGKLTEAIEAYRKAIYLKNDFADAYNNLGAALDESQKLDEAVAAYLEAIRVNSNSPRPYNNLCNTLRKQKKLKEAVEACNKAIYLKPNYAGAYYNKGLALYDQEKLDDSVVAFQAAIDIDPNYTDAHYNLGSVLKDLRRLEESAKAYYRAIQLAPGFAKAYNSLGITLHFQKKLDESVRAYQEAIQIKPDYALAYFNLGIALHAQQKPEEAIVAYRKAIEFDPEYSLAYSNLGGVLAQQNKVEEALKTFDQVLNLPITTHIGGANYFESFSLSINSHSAAYNSKGVVYAKTLQNLEEAIPAFKIASRLEPPFPQAESNLRQAQRQQRLQISPGSGLRIDETKYFSLNDPITLTKRSLLQVFSWSSLGAKGVQQGTGWLIHRRNNEAWIITNRHVVVDGNQPNHDIEVELFYGNVPDDQIPPRLPARLEKATEWADALDLAVLKVDLTNVPADVQALLVDQTEPNSLLNSPVMVIGNNDFRQATGKVTKSSQNQLTLDFQLEYGHSGSPVLKSRTPPQADGV